MNKPNYQEEVDSAIGAIVLLVEDDPDDVHVIEKVLGQSPIALELEVVANGRQALDYLDTCLKSDRSRMPDLVLLDLNMPQMDGHEFLAAVRGRREISALPVCVFTTSTDGEVVRRAYEAGANMVVNKVDTLEGMSQVLNSIVEFWFRTAKRIYI